MQKGSSVNSLSRHGLSAGYPLKARVTAFDERERQLAAARGVEARGQAALEWLQALKGLLAAVPIERTDDPIYRTWLDAHDVLVVYSEPADEWLIQDDVVWTLHDEHRNSAAADEIGWIAVTNGLSGECEGHIPCYAYSLNHLEGEYLRRHPNGRHRVEALEQIGAALRSVVDDLLSRQDRSDFLKIPDDCADLSASLVPLRRRSWSLVIPRRRRRCMRSTGCPRIAGSSERCRRGGARGGKGALTPPCQDLDR